jgi:heme/copper-type cytochrome/quinol oxidase subunit 2
MKPTIRARTILFALALALTACEAHPSVFAPAGPASRSIATLGGWVTGVFCVVAVVVIGLVAVAAFRRRGTLETHERFDAGGGHKWILIGGFAVPSVILAVIFVATLGAIDRFPLHDGEHYRPDIRVVGRQWWWEVQYVGDKTLVATPRTRSTCRSDGPSRSSSSRATSSTRSGCPRCTARSISCRAGRTGSGSSPTRPAATRASAPSTAVSSTRG